jgi:hypothetical protein
MRAIFREFALAYEDLSLANKRGARRRQEATEGKEKGADDSNADASCPATAPKIRGLADLAISSAIRAPRTAPVL